MNKKHLLLVFICLAVTKIMAQTPMTAQVLLQKSMAYHDPKGNWGKLHQKFYFHAIEPTDSSIYEQLFLDNRYSFFGHHSKIEGNKVEKAIMDTVLYSRVNGDTSMTLEMRKKCRVMPRAIKMARNSYTFLYGLPMKLTDKGVLLDPEVKRDTFNKKEYWVLKANFEKSVGKDTWFLYINPTTYAMEGYRFYHNRKPNDGEFIVCEDILTVQGMRLPRVRHWYSNETGEFIASDIIEKSEKWQWKPSMMINGFPNF
jgi:Family of unknown function (DUF6503)